MSVPANSVEPPKISVVMAAYNRAHELGEAIDSVLAQDLEDYELIVVDDGSTDGTEALVEGYGDRVRYIKKPNGGVGSARNAGIAAARGVYLAYCDADDEQFAFRLRAQQDVLDARPEVALVYSDFKEWVNGRVTKESVLHTRWLGPSPRSYAEDLKHHFSSSVPVSELSSALPAEYAARRVYFGRIHGMLCTIHAAWGCALMARTSVVREVGGHWEKIRAYEDWVLSAEISKHHDLAYMDLPLLLYRVHPEQLTGRARLHAECYRDGLQHVWRSDPVFYARHKAEIDFATATAFAILGEVEARDGNYAAAEQNFRRALGASLKVGKRPLVNLALSALRSRWPASRRGLMARLVPPVLGQSKNRERDMNEGTPE